MSSSSVAKKYLISRWKLINQTTTVYLSAVIFINPNNRLAIVFTYFMSLVRESIRRAHVLLYTFYRCEVHMHGHRYAWVYIGNMMFKVLLVPSRRVYRMCLRTYVGLSFVPHNYSYYRDSMCVIITTHHIGLVYSTWRYIRTKRSIRVCFRYRYVPTSTAAQAQGAACSNSCCHNISVFTDKY